MLHKKGEDYLYFSHIPRTGGRYSTTVLKSNGFIIDKNHNAMQSQKIFVDFQESMHMKIDTAYAIDPRVKNAMKFTVIRNPLDRFISACNSELIIFTMFGGMDNFVKLEDYGYFISVFDKTKYWYRLKSQHLVVNGLSNYPNNWFRKQVDFFDSSFFVWKFENGMSKNFREFLKKSGADVDINTDVEKKYRYSEYDIKIPNFSLPEKIEKNVLKYYEEDYEFWNSYKN